MRIHITIRQIFAVALWVAMFGVVTNAFAQDLSGEFRAPAVGSKVTYMIDGEETVLEVTKQDGFETRFSNNTGNYGVIQFIPDGARVDYSTSDIESLWPLSVGKSVDYKAAWNGNSQNKSAKVVAIEDVTVPAGTFKTFRIEVTTRNKWYADEATTWWSPELGIMVKNEGKVTKGRSGGWHSELVKAN